jgi:hypothetical protein|tara:strand:+ start:330 stop:1001 length:672 start_codon:yes stop_codon:yes gene_type:complete
MLANVNAGAALAVDVQDSDPRSDELTCAVSASLYPSPVARNTFTFEKYTPRGSAFLTKTWDDECVRYGQKVKICVNATAGGLNSSNADSSDASLYLRSFALSTTRAAKFSRKCEVAASASGTTYECVFELLTPDPTKRLVSEGVPIMAGAPVVIKHCQTNQCLGVPGFSFENDFGGELEVCAHTFSSSGNAYVMQGLASGKPTSMSTKAPGDVNTFVVVMGER